MRIIGAVDCVDVENTDTETAYNTGQLRERNDGRCFMVCSVGQSRRFCATIFMYREKIPRYSVVTGN